MDAVTIINNQLDVEKILKHYNFENIRSDGVFIRSCCKIHGGNNPTAFVINKETGLWYCHTGGCGGGDVYTLIEKLENVNFTSAVKWLADFFQIDISELTIAERKNSYLKELQNFIKMMKQKRKKDISEFTIEEEIREVTKFRQFKKETIDHFRLGYVESVTLKKKTGVEYVLKKRLAFPIIFNGIQVGISFRRTRSNDVPKWSHQPANIETGQILYNYDATYGKQEIVVCEGITDVWAFHEIGLTAVATFGAHITDHQYKLLLKTGADLVLAFDGDEAGRNITRKTIGYVDKGKKIIGLFQNKANLSIIEFDDGEDPESITREELIKKYENRKKLW